MATTSNPIDSSSSLATLAAVQRRLEQLSAFQARQSSPQATATLAEEEPELDEDYESVLSPAPAPPRLADLALHGLPGLVVRSLSPHTEADPAAILLQFLAASGNLVGAAPHCLVGGTRHGLNLFVVLVGESSKARKGTSWRQISSLLAEADPLWASRRVTTTRPTANSILYALRDEEPATDRRLFLLSEEFASILHVLGRQTGQLSPLLRCAWDGGDLCAQAGGHPIQATAAHVSMVGHVTQSELARYLGRTELHNGFANRCLWTSVRRSKCLPEGGNIPPEELSSLARELRRALEWAHSQTALVFHRTAAARDLWNDRYPALSESRSDAYGAATSRAEAQVLRLSAIYAALDCSPLVEVCHLQAALAVWDYCQSSARLFFDDAPTDPTARRIGEALNANPQGLTRLQIRGLFHGHINSDRLDLALEQLRTLGLINCRTAPGRGRPSTLWSPVEEAKDSNPEPDAGT
jgi:hypothetical protein